MRRRDLLALAAGTAIAPRLVCAQKKLPIVGFLHSLSAERSTAVVGAFRKALAEAGYVEGGNVAIEYRWADGVYERLPGLAADLVGRKVDVIVTGGGTVSAVAANRRPPQSRSSSRWPAIR
jgi:putative ABC transport system substrate-binding protein